MDSTLINVTLFGYAIVATSWGFGVVVFSATAVAYYVYQIVNGKQTIVFSTWLLLLILDTLAFKGQLGRGVFDLLILVFTAGALIAVVLSWWYGKPSKWSKNDTACSIIIAAVIIWEFGIMPNLEKEVMILWWSVRTSTLGLVTSLFGLTVATWPLIRATIYERHYENLTTWGLFLIGSGLTIADGKWLTGIWFAGIQLAIIIPVLYHHVLPKLGAHARKRN
ncbi:hypothetical protein HYW58_00155 [Candidatus Kaiserbacteria bacterium]|nr:hypothetical protein [Candidatus Kaiserbacteria bacterium]